MVHEDTGSVVNRDIARVRDVDLARHVPLERFLQVDYQFARVSLDLLDLHGSRSFRLFPFRAKQYQHYDAIYF